MPPQNAFASELSTAIDAQEAVEEICQRISANAFEEIDLLTVFFSTDFLDQAEQISASINANLRPKVLIGCCGESIIGAGREVEQSPAISVLACRLPGTLITPLHLNFEQSADGNAIVGWPDEFVRTVSAENATVSSMILLSEPFSFPADVLLERNNEDWPNLQIGGGVASGCNVPNEARLLLNNTILREGAVGVHLAGLSTLHVVSQGCRPIGKPLVVTEAEGNELRQLGGRPALLQLKEIFDQLPTSDQAKVQNSLHIGRVVNEYQDDFEQGDFLVRNVIGIDPDSGHIAVGDFFRPGQTVQFHIRDEDSADGEMSQLLSAARESTPAAGLLFSCNGRGTRMFSSPDHDASLIQQQLGSIPLAGFFAAGEIGPIGDKNYLHGFTTSMLFFTQNN